MYMYMYEPFPSDPKYLGQLSPKKDTPSTANMNIQMNSKVTILAISTKL